jgi:hypothetical protein
MEGRFFTWCLFIVTWTVVLGGCLYILDQLGLNEWQRFVALTPLLILLRFTVQRFLKKGK